MKSELMLVIDQIGREKGIDKAKVIVALELALLTAAKKRFGHGENIQVDIDSETGEISIVKKKTIAENVLDSKTEISLE
ncbi:MAG: transcription termination/antitermination protein NusA, partial [Nitrospirota bacterium]|nr:transcription termination/antitermination protein NusA [Nitrospirota bacterium]